MNWSPTARAIQRLLFAEQEGDSGVYAVMDGAAVPDLLIQLYEFAPDYECLYSGKLDPEMAGAAPYLVALKKDAPFTHWALEKTWGRSAGIFVTARPLPPEEGPEPGAAAAAADEGIDFGLRAMRRHFRKFLKVYGPTGKPMYFRYYDPRVLRVYLPTCNEEESAVVFGPVRSYLLEDEDPNVFLRFRPHAGLPKLESLLLAGADAVAR